MLILATEKKNGSHTFTTPHDAQDICDLMRSLRLSRVQIVLRKSCASPHNLAWIQIYWSPLWMWPAYRFPDEKKRGGHILTQRREAIRGRHGGGGRGGASILFEYCSQIACDHLRAVSRQKLIVVGRAGFPPCPGSSLSRYRWCQRVRPRA